MQKHFKKLRFLAVAILTLLLSCSKDDSTSTTVAPLVPSNLIGTVVSSTKINLSWTDNSNNETSFKIERKTGTGAFAVVGTTATDIATFSDTALTSGTTYVYRVYSNNTAGNSLTYSNELTLTTATTTTLCGNVTDIDGNVYPSVSIGTQCWMQTNLNVSKYRNGDEIPQVTDPTAWANLTTGAWCYYENNTANGTVYGKLYNWYAVNDPRGLAPTGYHIPSDAEWTTLTTFLGGETIAGSKMKATTLWTSPNTGATNSSGFTGLPGMNRDNYGIFPDAGNFGIWWSSTEFNDSNAWDHYLYYNNGFAYRGSGGSKKGGFSVRCLRD